MVKYLKNGLAAFVAFPALAASFPLEWNRAYDTDVPYEVELDAAKLAAQAGVPSGSGYAVVAETPDGTRKLEVTRFAAYGGDRIGLRFRVPAGTTALRCETADGAPSVDSTEMDNLFAGALDAVRWQVPDGLVCEPTEGGLVFRGARNGKFYASCEIALPAGAAGHAVRFEMDVESRSKMAWGNPIALRQLDAAGKTLPEDVVDPRSISHMRPPSVLCNLRANGRIHPQAAKVRLVIEIRCMSMAIDNHGMPVSDPSLGLNALAVTRLALRSAAQLPFPKYEDACFAPGVSGEPGDCALVLGGEKAFWWQSHSLACWAQGKQVHDEDQLFFPSAAGTVEAWFRPAWAADDRTTYFLFEGAHHRPMMNVHAQDRLVWLTYCPAKGELKACLRSGDFDNKRIWSAGAANVTLKPGAWSHVAFQWGTDSAEVFVDGVKVVGLPLAGWTPFDITGPRANEMMPLECYVGSMANEARLRRGPFGSSRALYPGAIDLVRASTGKRYPAKGFVPPRKLAADGATRALFGFDRSFDGVSGGGAACVPGTYRSLEPRTARKLAVDGKDVPYHPETIRPEADPKVVLNTLLYTNMPTAADFDAARITRRRTFDLEPGGTAALDLPRGIHGDFVEVANTGREPLRYPIVLNAGDVDPRSCGDMADTMGLAGRTGRERANRVFQYVLDASDYFMNHTATFPAGSDVPEDVEYKALMMLNGYCGFECGPLNNMTANFFACVGGVAASQNAGYGHSFQQAFYDGKNRLYDLSALRFYPGLDNESVGSLEEGENETAQFQRVGDYASHFIRNGTRGAYVQDPAFQAKVGMVLNPGESFRVWQANDGQVNDLNFRAEYPGNREKDDPRAFAYLIDYGKETHATPRSGYRIWRLDRFFPHYLNGFLSFDGRPDAANPAFAEPKDGSFCYRVTSGYPIVHAEYAAELKSGGTADLELSTDGGRTFRPVGGVLNYEVRARQAYLVRVKAPMAAVARFRARTEVMLNPRIFPGRLRAGANELTLKASSGGSARVTVQWREDARSIKVEGGLKSGFIPGFEHQTVLLGGRKPLALRVRGISPQATASGADGVTAELEKGVLRLGTTSDRPRLATVAIADGEARKLLTVIVCPGARLFTAAEAKLSGAARFAAADAESVQDRVICTARNDALVFATGGKLPGGEYVAFVLDRFAAHDAGVQGGELFTLETPGAAMADTVLLGQSCNSGCNFFFVKYGVAGGRAAWKWDYAMRPEWYYPYYPRYRAWRFRLPETDRVSLRMTAGSGCASGAEIAGLLLVPAPTQDFKCDLIKVLCGMNCQPGLVVAD